MYVLMGVCWPAWRVQGAVWRSVRATLVIEFEWRGGASVQEWVWGTMAHG